MAKAKAELEAQATDATPDPVPNGGGPCYLILKGLKRTNAHADEILVAVASLGENILYESGATAKEMSLVQQKTAELNDALKTLVSKLPPAA